MRVSSVEQLVMTRLDTIVSTTVYILETEVMPYPDMFFLMGKAEQRTDLPNPCICSMNVLFHLCHCSEAKNQGLKNTLLGKTQHKKQFIESLLPKPSIVGYTPTILALGRCQQEDQEFKGILNYIASSRLTWDS